MAEVVVDLAEVVLEEAGNLSHLYNLNHLSNLITIIGPTASGKTPFAVEIAKKINGEIISGDSRQIYRHMDIGTGKDLKEYNTEDGNIKHHLIDIRNPGEKYSLFDFQEDFDQAYKDIVSRNRIPILCGGTGLYIESVLKGYELMNVPKNQDLRDSLQNKSLDELITLLKEYKTLHNTTDTETRTRAIRAIEIAHYQQDNTASPRITKPLDSLIIGVSIDRDARRLKISRRLKTRLEEGMIDEVKEILSNGVSAEDLIYYGLEYKFVTLYVIGEISYQEMITQLEIAIHQFAKRQMTWFRGMERRGLKINWIDALLPMDKKVKLAIDFLRNNN